MQFQYNIQQSLKVNPPSKTYNPEEGINHVKRIHGHLPSLVKVDPKGNSLNPRKKEIEKYDHDGLTFFNGVDYTKELMVAEQRGDGKLELISGFGRCFWFEDHNIDTYMIDVVTFESDYWKSLWKIRFNASKDHVSKGLPNTEATLLKGLDDAKKADSINWKEKTEVMKALRFMTNGSKSEKQLNLLAKKWMQDNPSDDTIRALKTHVTNNLCKKMELPYKGYMEDASLSSYGRIGFNISRIDDIDIKMKSFIDLYEQHEATIELYGFIQHVVARNLTQQRKEMLETWMKSINWMNKHFPRKFKNIVQFKGFHAQLRTPNLIDEGKPTERGIVDVNGKIIIDKDPSI